MSVLAVIPARYGSTRFPAKVLAPLAGRPLIQHVWERTRRAAGVDRVVVATDDERVAAAVRAFGGESVMTPAELPSGTDRVAYAMRMLRAQVAPSPGLSAEGGRPSGPKPGDGVVINVQGDEPLMEPAMVAQLAALMTAHPEIPMATLKHRLSDPRDGASPHVVKVVTDAHGWALYFSRAGIPYAWQAGQGPGWAKHLGIYAYQAPFLETLVTWPPSPLEQAEGLEQLRVLEHGARIMVLETPHDTIGVDTPDDLRRAAERLESRA